MRAHTPSERDFDPYKGDLDAQCAWRNFGGLSLVEAIEKFRSHPEAHQEDFMHMGGKAFSYYFPVLDAFLRETVDLPEEDIDDRQSWIIPQCIMHQFEGKNLPYVRSRKFEALELCNFMLDNIETFEGDWDPPGEIKTKWEELKSHLSKIH